MKLSLENPSTSSKNLKQIFLYITGKCNAHCVMCYLYDSYYDYEHMPFSAAVKYLEKYRNMGAYRLTLLGGEPTLHPQLAQIVLEAKDIGFTYLRLTTNGYFDPDILSDEAIQNLDTLAFSIDGPTDELNRSLRKGIELNHIIQNMQIARELGYEIRVNSTITSTNISFVRDLIELSVASGASQINLNIVFPRGGAVNHPGLFVQPGQWLQVYEEITSSYDKYPIEIKIPPSYSKQAFTDEENCGHFAPIDSRLYIMPDGKAYACLLLLGDSSGMAQDRSNCSCWDLYPFCPFMPRIDEYFPLCIHLKRRLNQKEENPRRKL